MTDWATIADDRKVTFVRAGTYAPELHFSLATDPARANMREAGSGHGWPEDHESDM